MSNRWLVATLTVFTALAPVIAFSASRGTPPTLSTQARGILARRCGGCHGAEKQSGLDVRSAASLLLGGSRGPAVVPGQPDRSPLLLAASGNYEVKMPPAGPPVPPDELRVLRAWIGAKALWIGAPVSTAPTGKPLPWSFRKPTSPAVPRVKNPAWVQNPIDAFILAKLEAKGLRPAPPADRRTLIRRVYFDLIGLPPAPERVERFAADSAPDAYPRLVDELLASPQYGERWARHWLDVARYADSGGYETDIYYRNAWRYRDYVVKSFNDDKPYNRFVQEQVAGDELWPGDLELQGNYTIPASKLAALEAQTGTGLYTLGPQIHESNMDGKKLRYEWLTDSADTTGAVFLGLTVGCARCHDHKFDPISQKDYFGLQAVFAASREVETPVIDGMGIADFKQHYPRLLAVEEARTALDLFQTRTAGRSLTAGEQQERAQLLERLAGAVQSVPRITALGRPFEGMMQVPTVSALGHLDPALVPKVRLLNRGELTRPRETVSPALPAALRLDGQPALLPGNSFSRRKELALWLTRPDHPLTARVMVNRVWGWHFGEGLVATPNDFGKMGQPPSHPELLDWLATAFTRRAKPGAVSAGSGSTGPRSTANTGASRKGPAVSAVPRPGPGELDWSVKRLHRLILLSNTYQMSSTHPDPGGMRLDPDNRWLWRMNRRRLEAEALWDAIHAVGGTLNAKMGGRPVMPPLTDEELSSLRDRSQWVVPADPTEHTRRGIYLLVRRGFRFPFFEVLDAPGNSVSCPRRDVTTVAPQALWFLNNRTTLRQATHLAARVVQETGRSWNEPAFGPGQSGWIGAKAGDFAGWARRVDTGHPAPGYDAPVGTLLTHGATSLLWRVPAGEGPRAVTLRGSLWNVRRLGRAGVWKLWKNDRLLLSEGKIDDTSGTSAQPLNLESGSGGAAALREIPCAPGDSFRLEILEGDFVGVRFTVATGRTHDAAVEFDLTANPTAAGWQYSEALANGGGPVGAAARPAPPGSEAAAWVDRAWRLTLGRPPTPEEAREGLQLLEDLSRAGSAGAPLDETPPALAALPPARAAALTKLCLMLFNLNEFIFVD